MASHHPRTGPNPWGRWMTWLSTTPVETDASMGTDNATTRNTAAATGRPCQRPPAVAGMSVRAATWGVGAAALGRGA